MISRQSIRDLLLARRVERTCLDYCPPMGSDPLACLGLFRFLFLQSTQKNNLHFSTFVQSCAFRFLSLSCRHLFIETNWNSTIEMTVAPHLLWEFILKISQIHKVLIFFLSNCTHSEWEKRDGDQLIIFQSGSRKQCKKSETQNVSSCTVLMYLRDVFSLSFPSRG